MNVPLISPFVLNCTSYQNNESTFVEVFKPKCSNLPFASIASAPVKMKEKGEKHKNHNCCHINLKTYSSDNMTCSRNYYLPKIRAEKSFVSAMLSESFSCSR